MAIYFDNLEELKKTISKENTTKKRDKPDTTKADRLKLEQRKQAHKEQQDRERLKLLQEKEKRQAEKERHRQEQERRAYLIGIFASLVSLAISVVFAFVILSKFL